MTNKRLMEQTENENVTKKRRRPRIKLEDVPESVSSLESLIEIGKNIKFYRNIDTVMLWKITPYLEELNNFIGMEKLKESVFYQVIYYLQGMHKRNQNEEYLHTIITGMPGAGKTSVAKIIGKIYQSMDILSKSGKFKIAYRDDFIAEYLGQTAVKTKKLLKSCIGGVLFIDEVYALGPGVGDKDSFSKEALDTLNAFLSEHKNDFCCIAAGYEEDIKKCFFSMNKGLQRRFPWIHKIDEYDSGQLADIAFKMIDEMKWETELSKEDMTELLETNKEFFKFAGGDIETFLSKCKMSHAKRVLNKGWESKFVLNKEDMLDAIEMIKKYSIKNEKDDRPYGMYT